MAPGEHFLLAKKFSQCYEKIDLVKYKLSPNMEHTYVAQKAMKHLTEYEREKETKVACHGF